MCEKVDGCVKSKRHDAVFKIIPIHFLSTFLIMFIVFSSVINVFSVDAFANSNKTAIYVSVFIFDKIQGKHDVF